MKEVSFEVQICGVIKKRQTWSLSYLSSLSRLLEGPLLSDGNEYFLDRVVACRGVDCILRKDLLCNAAWPKLDSGASRALETLAGRRLEGIRSARGSGRQALALQESLAVS